MQKNNDYLPILHLEKLDDIDELFGPSSEPLVNMKNSEEEL